MSRPINTRTAKISLAEEGIVMVEFKKNIVLGRADIIENINASVKLTGGKHGAILKMNHQAGITPAALRYAGSRENAKYRMVNALIIKDTSVRLLWNLFSSFSTPIVKNRIFSNEKDGLRWVRGMMKKV